MKTFVFGWVLLMMGFCVAQGNTQGDGATFSPRPLEVSDLERFLGITSAPSTDYLRVKPFKFKASV